MKTYMRFYAHLERNSRNIYRSEKCFLTQVVQKNGPRISVNLTFPYVLRFFYIIQQNWGNMPELLRYEHN
jgi:hypothetical protein